MSDFRNNSNKSHVLKKNEWNFGLRPNKQWHAYSNWNLQPERIMPRWISTLLALVRTFLPSYLHVLYLLIEKKMTVQYQYLCSCCTQYHRWPLHKEKIHYSAFSGNCLALQWKMIMNTSKKKKKTRIVSQQGILDLQGRNIQIDLDFFIFFSFIYSRNRAFEQFYWIYLHFEWIVKFSKFLMLWKPHLFLFKYYKFLCSVEVDSVEVDSQKLLLFVLFSIQCVCFTRSTSHYLYILWCGIFPHFIEYSADIYSRELDKHFQ